MVQNVPYFEVTIINEVKFIKVLVLTAGSRGDVQPLLAFALKIKAKGHEVLFAAPENFESWIKSFGLDFLPYGQDIQKLMEKHASVLADSPFKLLKLFITLIEKELEIQTKILLEVIENFDIVLGCSLLVAAPFITEYYKKPYYYFAFSPNLIESYHHAPITIPFETGLKPINKLLWLAHNMLFNFTLKNPVNKYRIKFNLKPLKNYLDPLKNDINVILAAYEEIVPLPSDLINKVPQIGAFNLITNEKLPEDLEAFLNTDKPVVYFGFGSMTDPYPEKTTQIILETIKKTKIKAIISKGWSGLGKNLLENEDVKLISSISHHLLFPRVSAVIHHGGAGTTSTTALAGVPQIIIPHLMDQYYFGTKIYELNLGAKPISRKKLTSDNLAQAITYVISNKIVKESAKIMREKLLKVDSLDNAYNIIFNKEN